MKNLLLSIGQVQELKRVKHTVEPLVCPELSDLVKQQSLSLSYVATDVGEEILVRGTIKGTINFECSCCLEIVPWPVSLGFDQSYPSSGNEIDLSEEIREVLLLNVPLKPLCNPDCKGLCQHCGRNLNLEKCACAPDNQDPRWEKLRKTITK